VKGFIAALILLRFTRLNSTALTSISSFNITTSSAPEEIIFERSSTLSEDKHLHENIPRGNLPYYSNRIIVPYILLIVNLQVSAPEK
jgi:hypothetical protein